jgi:hypothetical protein
MKSLMLMLALISSAFAAGCSVGSGGAARVAPGALGSDPCFGLPCGDEQCCCCCCDESGECCDDCRDCCEDCCAGQTSAGKASEAKSDRVGA